MFLAGLTGSALQSATKRPNIVLVLFDDLGWKDFSCYGNPEDVTPNIDALATEGVRFTQAYAACPVCSPSRAALVTGKYPVRTGITDWIPGRAQWPTAKLVTPRTKTELALEEVTLAERLKPLGYRTASIGKWHLGGTGFTPANQGFDLNVGGNHTGSNPYFGPFNLPGLEGRTAQHYLTDELGDAARSFVSAASTPFFLYMPNYAVHLPLQAPGVKDPQNAYREMLRIADNQIGLIRHRLKQTGEDANTIWIVTSDNGGLRYEGKSKTPVTDNRPLRAGKGHLYEGGIRVPLIIKAPGMTQVGITCSERVSGIDLAPTVLDLLNQAAPSGVDGVSLKPLLGGRDRHLGSRPLFWHYPHYSNQGGVPGGAIIEGDWKLIEFYESNRIELFNLKEDPGETQNQSEAEESRATRMLEKLKRWRQDCSAVMPTRNPEYDPAQADQGLTGVEAYQRK